MIVVNNVEDLKLSVGSTSVLATIGNFDGVHLGHRDFLSAIRSESLKINSKLLVITFIPHPSFLLKGKSSFLINSYSDRRKLLEESGVDILFEIDFTRDFSTLTPEYFLENYLLGIKNIKKIFLGHDFQFGANKTGDYELAKKIASKSNVELTIYSEFKMDNYKICSSEIRNYISSGQMDEVSKLLGRDFYLNGRVIKGAGRGKQIGFPTANLGYDKDVIVPEKGVYISKTNISGLVYESVTNVGHNPTFNTGYDIHVETHILGFNREIYGDEITVTFIKKLRGEIKFSSVNELVSQIQSDVLSTQKYFENV